MDETRKSLTRRIAWVDVCKCICMLCVIMIHLESCTTWVGRSFGPWFLTAFFFVSGYCHKNGLTFRQHMMKKIKGLLLPWFIFSNLNIILSAVLSFKGERNLGEELFWNLLQIRGIMDGLWFVNCLFVAYIPLYFLARMKNKTVALLLSFSLSVLSTCYSFFMNPNLFPWGNSNLPWHVESIFVASFWMLLGFWFKQNIEVSFDKHLSIKNVFFIVCCYIMSLILLLNIDASIIRELYGYVVSFVGLLFIIVVSKKIRMNKYIAFVGANTLLYFAFHGKIMAIIEKMLHSKLSSFYEMCLKDELYSSCLCVTIALIISIVLVIPVKLVNRYLPQTLGRW